MPLQYRQADASATNRNETRLLLMALPTAPARAMSATAVKTLGRRSSRAYGSQAKAWRPGGAGSAVNVGGSGDWVMGGGSGFSAACGLAVSQTPGATKK